VTQSAIVEKLAANGDAMVRVYQKSACGHDCSDCAGVCGAKKSITVQARNPLRARPGNLVTVETGTGRILRAMALVYVLPLAVLLLSCALGYALGGSETVQALAGLGGLLLGCAAAVAVNRFIRRDRPLEYTIINIEEEREE
jgi:sigma-E factor negative regulatory protein RseC